MPYRTVLRAQQSHLISKNGSRTYIVLAVHLTGAGRLLYIAPHENEKESWREGSEEGDGIEEAPGQDHGLPESAREARGASVDTDRGGRGEETAWSLHAVRCPRHRLGAVPLSPAVAPPQRR